MESPIWCVPNKSMINWHKPWPFNILILPNKYSFSKPSYYGPLYLITWNLELMFGLDTFWLRICELKHLLQVVHFTSPSCGGKLEVHCDVGIVHNCKYVSYISRSYHQILTYSKLEVFGWCVMCRWKLWFVNLKWSKLFKRCGSNIDCHMSTSRIWGLICVNNVFTFWWLFHESMSQNKSWKVFVELNVETIARCQNLSGGFHWPLLSEDFYVFSRSSIKCRL